MEVETCVATTPMQKLVRIERCFNEMKTWEQIKNYVIFCESILIAILENQIIVQK
jgi:hypothetical protein